MARPLWSAPAHQLNNLTVKAAIRDVLVPTFADAYTVMPFRCMIDDADLERCETQIAAWRRKMELVLMDMEEVNVEFIRFVSLCALVLFSKFQPYILFDRSFRNRLRGMKRQ